MRAVTRPEASATPAPIMAAIMRPTAVKLMKFGISDAYMNRTPSADTRLRRAVVACLDLVGLRVDRLEGHGRAERAQYPGQDDHDPDQDEEDDDGMGNAVSDALHNIQKTLHRRFRLGAGVDHGAPFEEIGTLGRRPPLPAIVWTWSRLR